MVAPKRLVTLSDIWLIGEVILLVGCLLPTLVVYRLTMTRQLVGVRAFIQSIIWGGWVVFLVPAITFDVFGEDIWSVFNRTDWKVIVFYPATAIFMALGY